MRTETEKPTIWELFKCDKGNRWCQVKGTPFSSDKEGQFCNFSGCAKQHHRVYKMGETGDPDEAGDWFLRVNPT